MPTIPTNPLEAAMRAQYLQWLAGLPAHENDVASYIAQYQKDSLALISRMGGRVAALGKWAEAEFPVPKTLDLSPVAGVIYDSMQQAAISAGITAGLGSTDVARQMLNAGLGKNFNRLNRLARTETVSAYWKNAFDSTTDLPDIVMVWGSEESKRTCDYCRSRDGLVIEDGNIRDHPQGRCTPIPTLRSKVNYKGTLEPDGSVTMDPRWGKPAARPTPLPEDSVPTATQKDVLSGKSNPAAPSTASSINKSGRSVPTEVKASEAIKPAEQHSVKTFASQVSAKTAKTRVAEGDWRYIDDRKKRAVALLQNDFRAEKAVKRVASNLQNGREALDGVKVPTSWSKDYTGLVTDVGTKYSLDDVKTALADAGQWLHEQEAVTPRTLFKGLDVPKDKIAKLFKEGSSFDTEFSSFSADETVARGYSSRRATQQVIVRVKGAPAIKIDGNPTADFWKTTKEHLVTGKGTVTKVTEAHNGRTVYVDVEFK